MNLFVATDSLTALVTTAKAEVGMIPRLLLLRFIEGAEKILEDDIATNRAIGANGAQRILEIVGRHKIKVLTICNTGSLATAGYGTALGVVRSLHEMGSLDHVYACETRPYNQGARLTAFEIVQDKLPGTLITDSMASALMAVKGVDCVVRAAFTSIVLDEETCLVTVRVSRVRWWARTASRPTETPRTKSALTNSP